eukprot:366232-Chlamydomonas_euryale.AAC.4
MRLAHVTHCHQNAAAAAAAALQLPKPLYFCALLHYPTPHTTPETLQSRVSLLQINGRNGMLELRAQDNGAQETELERTACQSQSAY